MTKVQTILSRSREEYIGSEANWQAPVFFITRYNDHYWLLRCGLGLVKWFGSRKAAISWAVLYFDIE